VFESERARAADPSRRGKSMSSDEKTEPRDEPESKVEDVLAHRYVAEEPGDDDPERKRKRKQAEEAESDEFGRRKK
jgi:hypothetical protein